MEPCRDMQLAVDPQHLDSLEVFALLDLEKGVLPRVVELELEETSCGPQGTTMAPGYAVLECS